jgi:hypothetical protein
MASTNMNISEDVLFLSSVILKPSLNSLNMTMSFSGRVVFSANFSGLS